MKRERWARLKELHAQALELPAEERRAFVEGQAAGDAELLEAVLELLALQPPHDFLEPSAGTLSGVPRRLGDFELLEEIGRGGMGVVFRARQLSLKREVALKILLRANALDTRRVQRFQREAQAVARLRHDAIVQIYSVGFDEGFHYFAMELIRGHGLNREIESHLAETEPAERVTPLLPGPDEPAYIARVTSLCATVADALQHAHARGLVHRDVKPHNILLDERGEPHLADFGLARDEELETVSREGDVAGTPHYMSPEQAAAKRLRIDHRTDVFSLGVVLYELLALKRPFQGKTSQEVLQAVTSREPRELRKENARVPRDLETICHKALSKSPDGRYATAGEFAADLRRFLGHEAIHAKRPGAWKRFALHVRRRRSWYVPCSGAGLLLALGLGTGYSWIHGREVRAGEEPLQTLAAEADFGALSVERLLAGQEQARKLRASGLARSEWLGTLEERLEAEGRARLEQGRALLELGIPSPPGTPIEDYRSGSDPDYFRGLELLWQARLLLPDDPEAARWADVSATFPRLEVEAPPECAGWTLYAQTIDWLSQEFSEPKALATLPHTASLALPPGHYRFTLVQPGSTSPALCEFTRTLERRGQSYRLQPRPRERADVLAGMRPVQGGVYVVGDPENAGPFRARRTRLPAFYIDAKEVTNAEYGRFAEATGREKRSPQGPDPDWDSKPVIGLSFREAQAYAEWAGKRLPTWFEWEAAARGPGGHPFPWGSEVRTPAIGEEPEPDRNTYAARLQSLRPVGTRPHDLSPLGLLDVHGNAWEWTESILPALDVEGNPYPALSQRIVKGDCPDQKPLYLNTECPVVGGDIIGFRCATSVWIQ